MDDVTGGIVTKSADWLITQGVLGIAVMLLILVIVFQRREINSVRTQYDERLEARDKAIEQLQHERYNDLKTAFEPIRELGATFEAVLNLKRGR